MPKYADLLNKAVVKIDNGEEARAEQIFVNALNRQELRFSWWTQEGHQFQRAPLDLTEDDWLLLFEEAVKCDIFSQDFIKKLSKILVSGIK